MIPSFRHLVHEVAEGARSLRWPRRPQHLNLELTAACDARCIHCPREAMDRPARAMDFALYRKIIDQASDLGVPCIVPNGYGEILTLKALPRYLDYLRSRDRAFKVFINTNGSQLNDDRIELFFRCRIDLLNVTIDGATRQTAETIRVGLKFDRIEANVHRLLARRKERGLKYPKVRVGLVVIEQNQHEAEQFIERWQGIADDVVLSGYSNRGGSLNLNGAHGFAPRCSLPFSDLNIWADGKAVLCCNDWNEEYVVGDLNTQSLDEVWHGEAFARARELHRDKRGAEIALCHNCNAWIDDSRFVRLWS